MYYTYDIIHWRLGMMSVGRLARFDRSLRYVSYKTYIINSLYVKYIIIHIASRE
jgi:hypothetical protein